MTIVQGAEALRLLPAEDVLAESERHGRTHEPRGMDPVADRLVVVRHALAARRQVSVGT